MVRSECADLLTGLKFYYLLLGPFGQVFIFQRTDEVASVPSGFFTIAKAGGIDGAPRGSETTTETSGCVPDLVFLRPVRFLQRKGAQNQNLADKFLPSYCITVGTIEQRSQNISWMC